MTAPSTCSRPGGERCNHVNASGTYRFTGNQYRQMIEIGVLGPEDRVELIQGGNQTQGAHEQQAQPINRAARRLAP